jgi:hypothetical protein
MVEYLRLSPSYALAADLAARRTSRDQAKELITNLYQRGSRAQLPPEAKRQLVEQFQSVIRTHEEFGDLEETQFDEWWNTRGIGLFGMDRAPPKARAIAHLTLGASDVDAILNGVKKYRDIRQSEGLPSTLIAAIPLGITKRMQMRLVSKLLEGYREDMPIKSAKTKRPLAVQRLRKDPLEKGIHLMWLHARHPDLTLWRLGVAAKVSRTYSGGLDTIDSRALDSNADNRNSLAILTRRMLTRAQLIAENAAHGIFPSNEKRPLPEFNIKEVYSRMIRYNPKLRRKQQPSNSES